MIILKNYCVTFDRFYEQSIEELDENELKTIFSYTVQKNVLKTITQKVQQINEWELPWNDYSYQQKQFYEYGTIVHLLQNPQLIENTSHIGLFHYDVKFKKNSINQVINQLSENPNTIFYQKKRENNELFMPKSVLKELCVFINEKLSINSNFEKIWNDGWISEALSITPREDFLKFGQFLLDNKLEIESLLVNNKWGIMNSNRHRVCGLVERMWGIYLVSLDKQLFQLDIDHDWYSYTHQHLKEKNWIKHSKLKSAIKKLLNIKNI
jgi:hypothetical protein